MRAEAERGIPGFCLLSQLGEGATGTVFRAVERFTERQVAVKVLKPECAADPEIRDRFVTEARAIARLEHPCICRLFRFEGEHRPPFLVTQLVEGESVTQALTRGPLPEERVARLVRDLGSALWHAHRSGVLHRDVKSANTLLATDGRTILTDFGTALLTEGQRRTQPFVVVGTPEYLSPERVRGESASPASDQFALGVVAYEALTGELPHRGGRPEEVAYAILNEPPTPPSERNRSVHPTWDSMIMTALDPDPHRRFASLGELVDAVPVLAIPLSGPSLAVLRFSNVSADRECDEVCEGLPQDLATEFACLPNLSVAAPRLEARVEVGQTGGTPAETRPTHRLEGSVQRVGDTLRVNVRLIRMSDGRSLWGCHYDRRHWDTLRVQADLAREITQGVHPHLVREFPGPIAQERVGPPGAPGTQA